VSPAVRLYAAVGLGSGLGAVARYLVSLGLVAMFGQGFPWATLAVNVVGSFVIGFYAMLTEPDGRLFVRPAIRQFVLAGFCGGFTTMSSFVYELGQMVQDKEFYYASSYFIATLAGAGLAFIVGLLISDLILR